MKTKFNLLLVGLIALSIPTLSSCGNDGDTTRPVINLIEPAEDDVLTIGEAVHLEMELSDNEMLSSYKIDIHSAAGHDHSRAEAVTTIFEDDWDVSGQKNVPVHHHEIVIPADAEPGDYHLMIYCTDAAGNVAHVARGIVLSTEGGEGHDHGHDH